MASSNNDYLRKILLSPVYDVAVKTDLDNMIGFSQQVDNQVWLKREDQQPVKSFKLRGAYNCIAQLSAAQQQAGIIAASAGNHAQGVAYSANKRRIKATIVMPETTPEIKIEAVKAFGGQYVEVQLVGKSYDDAKEACAALAKKHGYTEIPPFDHPDVIAGQGTVAKELLDQNPNLDMVFVAVGGGGLMAGIGVFLKQLKPSIKLIAIEAEDSACLKLALATGEPRPLDTVGIFADGVAVKVMGDETFRLCQQVVDDCITVNSDEICAAIKDIFDDTRVIAEPAGALSVAGIRKYVQQHQVSGKSIAGILCGANINFHTLRYVSERCELGEQKEAVFAVKIPERTGAFREFCQALGGRSITEFNYRYASSHEAHIFVGTKLRGGRQEYQALSQQLSDLGYPSFDLSDNEIAKLHVRYMVGGRPSALGNERIFAFQFPEYPGALMNFLDTLGETWNITMFHYRNHGAADGMVLAGFQLPDHQTQAFYQHLKQLGYAYEEHTDNPAYNFFLSGLNSEPQ